MPPSDETPPSAEEFASVFDAYEVRREGERVLYVGESAIPIQQLERELWPLFRERGYELSVQRGYQRTDGIPISRGEYVLVAEPNSMELDGIPRTNLLLFVATIFSTTFAGAYFWYQVPLFEKPWLAVKAWPFVVAILGVLGVHELGHYVMSRYHNVQASLPYFIPLPTYIGSMGAVIKMEGKIPDRKALFDIGAAGPLAGLAATVVVTAIGLQLDPIPAQEAAVAQAETGVRFNHPPLLELIALATGATEQLEANTIHPVVFGGWVGMLVTLLNMLPVGQLDGGHILRAMVGKQQERIAAVVPAVLFGLAAYLLVVADGIDSVGIWTMWGLFAVGLAYAGPADPIDDSELGWKRTVLGVLTFVLAALCFTPIPVEIVELA
ncbi:site-2 protease family protein [Halovenus sp. WSH3]|uniref:Site-2 protease family protein n=1 Tax=Halovenus carboxidivorans TaxID=2692199 RepID=A0A6B0T478_9EURY|nr:site-2 protease family protein [Halovenus carboxidivorans]MXR51827.1 site-2 protease family protein [Halovenus carboxidivorans]